MNEHRDSLARLKLRLAWLTSDNPRTLAAIDSLGKLTAPALGTDPSRLAGRDHTAGRIPSVAKTSGDSSIRRPGLVSVRLSHAADCHVLADRPAGVRLRSRLRIRVDPG